MPRDSLTFKQIEAIYRQGAEARRSGKDARVCPYRYGSEERRYWVEGWEEAFLGD